MAVTKFQQVIWSKKIQDDLELKCKLVDNCTREYEGDCEQAKSVRILGVGNPTIGQYTGADITIEEMTDKDQLLNIDQANYFAFEVKDVDKAQSVPGLPEKYQKKAVHGLAVKRDSYVAGLALTAENVTTYEDGLTTQGDIKNAIDDALVALRERNVDVDNDVVIEISPAIYRTFKNELIELKTNNDELIKKGVVGMYDSANVIMTNNLAKADGYIYVMVRTKTAVAFAGQINEVEAGRMERRFSDYIRGLDTFGSKIIAQDEIQVLKIKLAGEGGNEAGESGNEAGESGNVAGEGGNEAGESGNEAGESGNEAGEGGNEAGEGGNEAGEGENEAGEGGNEAGEGENVAGEGETV